MPTLVLNAGSSSLKAALFNGEEQIAAARAEEIGRDAPSLRVDDQATALPTKTTHESALSLILTALGYPQPVEDDVNVGIELLGGPSPHDPAGPTPAALAATKRRSDDAAVTADGPGLIDAVGHRIVHGGELFTEATIVDDAAFEALAGLNALAPLHNPIGLRMVRAAREALPDAVQVACFDTAFHATQPPLATRFAIPEDDRTQGLRRYGFHGLSYQGLVGALAPTPKRLLGCHLGAGASMCAILDGRSVATSMGYSPLDGLMMGTRSGAIDPARRWSSRDGSASTRPKGC